MPDNAGFYHAAYLVAAGLYAAYSATLWLRGRALARREAALDARDRATGGAARER